MAGWWGTSRMTWIISFGFTMLTMRLHGRRFWNGKRSITSEIKMIVFKKKMCSTVWVNLCGCFLKYLFELGFLKYKLNVLHLIQLQCQQIEVLFLNKMQALISVASPVVDDHVTRVICRGIQTGRVGWMKLTLSLQRPTYRFYSV